MVRPDMPTASKTAFHCLTFIVRFKQFRADGGYQYLMLTQGCWHLCCREMSISWVTKEAGTPTVWWGTASHSYQWHAVGQTSTYSKKGIARPAPEPLCCWTQCMHAALSVHNGCLHMLCHEVLHLSNQLRGSGSASSSATHVVSMRSHQDHLQANACRLDNK